MNGLDGLDYDGWKLATPPEYSDPDDNEMEGQIEPEYEGE